MDDASSASNLDEGGRSDIHYIVEWFEEVDSKRNETPGIGG